MNEQDSPAPGRYLLAYTVTRSLPALGVLGVLKKSATPLAWRPPERRSTALEREFLQQTTGKRLCLWQREIRWMVASAMLWGTISSPG